MTVRTAEPGDEINEASVWKEVDAFLDEHRSDYNMPFGLEYSSTVDWCADFTPRRNHPQAREYGLWKGQASRREDAIRKALAVAQDGIAKHEQILNDSPEYRFFRPLVSGLTGRQGV